MQGDQLTWHWDIPASHPFSSDIDFGFREGFAGSKKPKKLDSDAGESAYRAGVRARDELRDEERHFAELRVRLAGDEVTYDLT